MVGNRIIRFVIVLDSCCISIGLMFIKDRPVSSFLGASFSRFRGLRFQVLDALFFRFRGLRLLGASFSRFGFFALRSTFSSAWFSKLPNR